MIGPLPRLCNELEKKTVPTYILVLKAFFYGLVTCVWTIEG